MDTAKIFQNGKSQAIRLPKEYRFRGTKVYVKRLGNAEAQGLPIGALDTSIAAQAVEHHLTLVTNNVREFSRVPGLTIEDWTQL